MAKLLRDGCSPGAIVLITFTRTAVKELRDRIAALAGSGVDSRGVEIRTVDSFAWRLRKGFLQPNARVSEGSYSETFRRAIGALEGGLGTTGGEPLASYLTEVSHVMVDECQDLVGIRAHFVEALLKSLAAGIGWTVFIDPAQAIYDWIESDAEALGNESFVQRAATLPGLERCVRLKTLHRTSDNELIKILRESRKIVLDGESDSRLGEVRSLLLDGALCGGAADQPALLSAAREAGTSRFILFRRRSDALSLSGTLVGEGIPHRLRLGHLAAPMAGWVGALSTRLPSERWSEADVAAAWLELTKVCPVLMAAISVETAWRTLRAMARDGKSSVKRDRVAAAIAAGMVPDDLLVREIGRSGPVVGTVHASKGREADDVVLIVPKASSGAEGEEDSAEEARVLYVGLSRARRALCVLEGSGRSYFSYHATGRAWRKTSNGNIQMEIGRGGDVHPAGSLLAVNDPRSAQELLLHFDGAPRAVCAAKRPGDPELKGGKGWRYNLHAQDDAKSPLGSLTAQVDSDAYAAGKRYFGKAPSKFLHGALLDVSTMSLPEGDPLLPLLPEPWRTQRLWLAPVIAGLFVGMKPWAK